MSPAFPVLLALRDNSADSLEAQADLLFAPTRIFSLTCLYTALVINCVMLGIYIMMLLTYLNRQRHDRLWIQLILAATTILNFVSVIYWIYYLWYLFVENFGLDGPVIEVFHLSWFPVIDSLASSIVQAFFTYRAWRLNNRNWWLAGILAALIIGSFAGALGNHFIYITLTSELEAERIRTPTLVWLPCIMAADILITITTWYGLYMTRTGWSYTDKMITKLVRLCFLTQLPPTLLTVFFLIEFLIQPASFLGVMVIGIQTSFYALGLIYSLNSRVGFVPTNITVDNASNFETAGSAPADQTIHVDVTTDVFETYKTHRGVTSINRQPLGPLDDFKRGTLSDAEMGLNHAVLPGLDTIPDLDDEKAKTTLVNDASTKSLDRDADVHVLEVSTSGSDNTSAHAASDRL